MLPTKRRSAPSSQQSAIRVTRSTELASADTCTGSGSPPAHSYTASRSYASSGPGRSWSGVSFCTRPQAGWSERSFSSPEAMNVASSVGFGNSTIFAPSPRKPCHSSPSSSSQGGAYNVSPIRPFTVSVMGTMDASRALVISETYRQSPSSSLDDRTGRTTRWRLVSASTLMLFLELALIRWLGAEVLHLSYFSNFVLLGSFLGVGLGFLRAAGPTSGPPAAPVLAGGPARVGRVRQRLSGDG